MWVLSGLYLIPSLTAFFDEEQWDDHKGIIILMSAMSFSVNMSMLFFNGWNWYLAFSGNTAIDFW